jgi:hypothetical protein
VVWKEGSGASRPPVKAAEEEEGAVVGRSEVVSRRALLLSAVEYENAKSQLIDWAPRWLGDNTELLWLPEDAEEFAWSESHGDV